MTDSKIVVFNVAAILFQACHLIYGQEWPPPNTVDLIRERMDTINSDNCQDASIIELRLPSDALSHLPTYSQISDPDFTVPENRSDLVFLHNLALSRGFFFSFINGKMNESFDFINQPDWLYYYMSTWADVATSDSKSSPVFVDDSGTFYDQNKMYANWYTNLDFNKTLELFGPRVWRDPECNGGSIKSLCQEVNNMVSSDFGAGENRNYTAREYKHNPWYELYLPDDNPELDPVKKQPYNVELKYADEAQSKMFTFFGVSLPETDGDSFLPVTYTVPYFDCRRSNKWLVSTVSPFVDFLPRYLEWIHLRRHQFVGVSVVDRDYEDIDINQCPLSTGNEAPNYFAGTALCKSTTWCEPLPRYGFQRGGYQCHCNEGLVYPPGQNGPFQGPAIENSTRLEYEQGFDCVEPDSGGRQDRKIASQRAEEPTEGKQHSKWIPKYKLHNLHKSKPHQVYDLNSYLQLIQTLELPAEFTYNADVQFKLQSHLAVRLAHFLSSYLQTALPPESKDGSIRDDLDFRPDKHLSVDQLYGETLSIVMADTVVHGCGIYFDEQKFISNDKGQLSYFAPYSTRKNSTDSEDFLVSDAAEFEPIYTEQDWFVTLKDMWQNPAGRLKALTLDLEIRSNINGDNVTAHPYSPVTYYAAGVEDGMWTNPYLKCPDKQKVDNWVLTYAIPFFGLGRPGGTVEFHGAVTVDISLNDLTIDQCDNSPLNAFANTAKCNTQISKCVNLRWRNRKLGGYRCICLSDSNKWTEGITLETEYDKMVKGISNSFHELRNKC